MHIAAFMFLLADESNLFTAKHFSFYCVNCDMQPYTVNHFHLSTVDGCVPVNITFYLIYFAACCCRSNVDNTEVVYNAINHSTETRYIKPKPDPVNRLGGGLCDVCSQTRPELIPLRQTKYFRGSTQGRIQRGFTGCPCFVLNKKNFC